MIDAIKPKKIGKKLASIADPMSLSWNRNAPNIAGTDNMKLNFAANSFSRPAVKPAAIVVPERERQGKIAHACPNPIHTDSFAEMFRKLIIPLFIL